MRILAMSSHYLPDEQGAMFDPCCPDHQRQTSQPSREHDMSILPDASHEGGESDSGEILGAETTSPDSSLKEIDNSDANPGLNRHLGIPEINVPQLIQEVKGIYAGLFMVEKKCIEIVSQQAQNPTILSKEQWQALIALHRTLLNEHHDFFSASHHPLTKDHELRELAARYVMPARLWRHGIHAFLELLRHRLPQSLEHMLSFVYLSYSMIAILMETVPDFLATWIECLGDIARYRMAIEEADIRDREIWSNTARMWYNQAADLSPQIGRIQHHLAVLARPNIVQQLFLYSKALVAAVPFNNASESIHLLFNPLFDQNNPYTPRYQAVESSFVCAGAILFKRRSVVDFKKYSKEFETHLNSHLVISGPRFKTQGPEYAGALFAMIMDFGNVENTLWTMISDHQREMKRRHCQQTGTDFDKLPNDFVVQDPSIIDPVKAEYWSTTITSHHVLLPGLLSEKTFLSGNELNPHVESMLFQTVSDIADHIGNINVVPFMHMVLAYLLALTWIPGASVYIEKCIPWEQVAKFLNTVGRSGISYKTIESKDFPRSCSGSKQQLPEDFLMRGLAVMIYYYKPGFFDELVDEDERLLEQPSHQAPRVERCLWAGMQLAETVCDIRKANGSLSPF